MMTNDEIASAVGTIVRSFMNEGKVKEQDKPVIEAGVKLIVNLLQNLNDIAEAHRAG